MSEERVKHLEASLDQWLMENFDTDDPEYDDRRKIIARAFQSAILEEREALLKFVKSKISESHSEEWNMACTAIALKIESGK